VKSWRRAAARRRQRQPRCTFCGGRIPRSEPDVILEHAEAPGRLAFHLRCALPAFRVLVAGKPGVWVATARHVDAKAN
jgi:hypothetical protein